jgi:hypothetical protein
VNAARDAYIAALTVLNVEVVKTIYIETQEIGTSLSTVNENVQDSPAAAEAQFAGSFVIDNH